MQSRDIDSELHAARIVTEYGELAGIVDTGEVALPDASILYLEKLSAYGEAMESRGRSGRRSVKDVLPGPEVKQLATELTYMLVHMQSEMPRNASESSVVGAMVSRSRLFAQTINTELDNDWAILAEDAASFRSSIFAQAASLAAMAMVLMLAGDHDKAGEFATASCDLAARPLPERKRILNIRYGWQEAGFRTTPPAWWAQILHPGE